MMYTKNLPQIKVSMDSLNYNTLLELISQGTNSTNQELKEKSIKAKNKLLKYCVPTKNELKEVEIKGLFYINELTDILEIIIMTSKIQVTENYYNRLLKLKSDN